MTRLGIEVDTGALAVLEKFRSGVSNALMGLAAVAAGVGTAFVGAVSHAAHAADEMGDLAEKLGVNAEALQELRVAAELSDVSFESLTTGMKFLAKNAAEAAHGSAEAADAFKGIVTKDAKGQLLTADELLMNVAKRFEEIKDPAEKMRLAMKLGGRGGAELIPMLNRGAEGIAAFRKEAQEMGVVFGQEALEQADEFGRELVRVKLATEGLRNTFAVPFFKVFVNGVKLLVGVLRQLRPAIDGISKGFAEAGARMASVLGTLKNIMGIFSGLVDEDSPLAKFFKNADWIAALEAALVGLGVVFVATAAAAIGSWLAAAAPFILLSALIGFIVDEINTFIKGGDTVLGDLIKWADAIGDPNEHPIVLMLRKAVSLMFDLTDPEKWTRLAAAAISAIGSIVNAIPGGRLLASYIANQAATGATLARVATAANSPTGDLGNNLMESLGFSQGAGFRQMEAKGIATQSMMSTRPEPMMSMPQQSFAPVININGSGLSGEELQSRVENALNASYSKAMPAASGGGNGS